MKQWFVAHTNPSKELMAQQHLLEQDFEVYLPRFQKTRRHARKIDEVLYPLFPRYLFVALDLEVDGWRTVNGTRGVSYLLMVNDRPAVISSLIVDGLKRQEDDSGLVTLDGMSVFTQGDRLRIVHGVFEGQTATFQGLDDKRRVALLLSFLGREIKVSLPSYAVEAA